MLSRPSRLERLQERYHLLLLDARETLEAMLDAYCLTGVSADSVFERKRCKVVHVARLHSKAPKRHSAKLVGGILRSRLNDSIACADVMKQEVAEGVDDSVPKGVGHLECSPVHGGSRRRRRDRLHVANIAADLLE